MTSSDHDPPSAWGALLALPHELPEIVGPFASAYNLVAAMLLVLIPLNVLLASASHTPIHPGWFVVQSALAVLLLRRHRRGREIVLLISVASAGVMTLRWFHETDAASALLLAVAQWGLSGGMIIALTGYPSRLRLLIAAGIYLLFGVAGLSLISVAALLPAE